MGTFFYIKTAIREAIITNHGTIRNFIDRNPEKDFTSAKISQTLNPSKNVTLESLTEILDCLNLEFCIRRAITPKHKKQTVPRAATLAH